MKTSKILCTPAIMTFASLSTGLSAWGLNRFKQIVAGLLLGAALLVTTAARAGHPELPVDLLSAGDFVILAKTGISTVPYSDIKGDMGVSPIDRTAITGFSLIMDGSSQFSTSAQVTGKIYAADYMTPTPSMMISAISDMESAFTDAAGRSIPDTINHGATAGSDRDIGGLTMYPGLHKWSTGVLISTDVTLDAQGDPAAVFIFQISGDLTVASTQKVILSGGAQAKNIFWQVEGGAGAIIGTYAHFEGIVLTAKAIVVQTGASFNGKLLAQTAVTLDQNNIVDSNLIDPPNVVLEIVSEHGTGLPPVGIYTNDYGVTLTNVMTDVETLGGTQYVNTGWSMIGNEPFAGITNAMSMVHTNDAVLTWLWSTNYLLTATVVGNGSVSGDTNGFYAADAPVTVVATPDVGYLFDHWEVNGVDLGSAPTLPLTMDEAKNAVAIFSADFIDVTTMVDFSVDWVFYPRKGYFLGAVTINNTNSQKVLMAPFWFEVEKTEWHWLRNPTGFDSNTGLYYVDISAAINAQLPGIGNGDLLLDQGESVTVTGIELMGRRTPTGLVVAMWADPPVSDVLHAGGIPDSWVQLYPGLLDANNTLDPMVDYDGDGMTVQEEYIAGTNPTDPESFFSIRPDPATGGITWVGQLGRVYTVLATQDLREPFTVVADGIEGHGEAITYLETGPQALSSEGVGAVFYRIKVRVK